MIHPLEVTPLSMEWRSMGAAIVEEPHLFGQAADRQAKPKSGRSAAAWMDRPDSE